ncbi:MAG: MFS transporter [Eubacteriales bacterium]|nr:MFS transporter [Eubacteriales bacterium]
MEKRNLKRYYLRYVLYYFAYTMITGGIIQSFMIESGISGLQVSVYTSVIQVAQAAVMLLFSVKIENAKNLIKLNVRASYAMVPSFVAVFLISMFLDMSVNLKYALMVAAGIIANMGFGIIAIIEYKLPYRLMDISHYGRVVSITGVFISLSSLAMSSLFSFAISRFEYFTVMSVFIVVGLVMLIASMFVGMTYEDIGNEPGISQFMKKTGEIKAEDSGNGDDGTGDAKSEKASKKKPSIFTYPIFRRLFAANFIRGFSSGTFALLTTIGYHYGIINAESATWMVIIGFIITLVTCFAYAKLSRYGKDAEILLISGIAMILCLLVILVGRNTLLFLVIFAIGTCFKTFIDYVCPVIITQVVDYEIIGQFSAWRVALYMLGAAVAGVVLIPMLDGLGGEITMLINGLGFLYMGFVYFAEGKRAAKTPR